MAQCQVLSGTIGQGAEIPVISFIGPRKTHISYGLSEVPRQTWVFLSVHGVDTPQIDTNSNGFPCSQTLNLAHTSRAARDPGEGNSYSVCVQILCTYFMIKCKRSSILIYMQVTGHPSSYSLCDMVDFMATYLSQMEIFQSTLY